MVKSNRSAPMYSLLVHRNIRENRGHPVDLNVHLNKLCQVDTDDNCLGKENRSESKMQFVEVHTQFGKRFYSDIKFSSKFEKAYK